MTRIIGLHYDLHIFLRLNSLLGRMKYHFINKLKLKQILNQNTDQSQSNKGESLHAKLYYQKGQKVLFKTADEGILNILLCTNNLQHKRINMTFKFPFDQLSHFFTGMMLMFWQTHSSAFVRCTIHKKKRKKKTFSIKKLLARRRWLLI